MKSRTKLISGIKDWSRIPPNLLPQNTVAAKNMRGVNAEDMGLYFDEKGYFHTSGYVGIGWLRDYRGNVLKDPLTGEKYALEIVPRFAMNPWEMLIKVMNDPEYELYIAEPNEYFFEIYTDDDLIPVPNTDSGGELLAAISFVKECQSICKKHLRQEVSFHEENLNGKVVGNIQVAKHIKKNIVQAREDRVFCRFPVFTVDVLENRILKAALLKTKKIFKKNGISVKDLGRMYSYCENSLKKVKSVSISKSDFARTNLTGFNSYYKNVMELAKIVLLGLGANDLVGEETNDIKYVLPYTINMESLFEFYTRACLKEYLRKNPDIGIVLDEYRMPQRNPLTTLKESDPRTYLMNYYIPDIALMTQDSSVKKYIAVFDVKYQNSTNTVYAETRRHNSHQLLFYALLLNVRNCGFIFPEYYSGDNEKDCHSYQLNIQPGNAMDSTLREYSQWTAGYTSHTENNLAERLIQYIKGLAV